MANWQNERENIMNSTAKSEATLNTHGYCHLAGFLPAETVSTLETEFHRLNSNANRVLAEIKTSRLSFVEYYQRQDEKLIVVPEAGNPTQTCRFEYISASSDYIKQQFIPLCQKTIQDITGSGVNLFKDKCNLKSPGGGAFTAHQDIPAYLQFGPAMHITAAVFLDEATTENGALSMCTNYQDVKTTAVSWQQHNGQQLPIFDTYQGGTNNGRILQEIEQQMQWQMIFAKPGDVILFNSYVPHKSEINRSANTRRAFFFTFNLAEEGEHYQQYYAAKRANFANPQFHIATPTQRY